jgi:hypothetical protein
MLYLKKICLPIFIIITILFTVGYASQPIIEINQLTQESTNTNTRTDTRTDISSSLNQTLYINKISRIGSNIQSTYSGNKNYTDINNDIAILFKTLLYACIATTVLLTIGILLGYLGLKFISKIIFFLAMILMIAVFIIIQVIILTDSLITNFSNKDLTKPTISNGVGYYLILASVCLMIITYLIYSFLA